MDDLAKLLAKLPEGLRDFLLGVLEDYAIWIELSKDLPPFIKEMLANSFLHQVVKYGLKKFDLDNDASRNIALKWARRFFDLGDSWEPDWLLPAPVDPPAPTVPPA